MSHESVMYRRVATPIGPLLLTSEGRALTGLYLEAHKRGPEPGPSWQRDDHPLDEAVDQLRGYFAGDRRCFELTLELRGTPFQRTVWKALQEIPFGATIRYAELAERIGAPGAARAVGAAVGRNPVSIIVPCHRVVGSTGHLTGYAGGLDRKRWLLDHEHAGALARAGGRLHV